MEWLYFTIGLLTGIIFFWLLNKGLSKNTVDLFKQQIKQTGEELEKSRLSYENERVMRAALEARLDEAAKSLRDQKVLLEEASKKFADAFAALSKKALESNNQMFLDLAKSSLEGVISEAKGEFGQRQEAIKGIVDPLKDILARYEQQISSLEKRRATDYGSLDAQIKALMVAQRELQKETGNLVTALRKPEVKGNWGQVSLKRVVELAGMSEYCDFYEQVSVDSEEGRLRPDMIVRLPSEREIVIDSKVSTSAYFDAIEADSEESRKNSLVRHAQQVRKHMRDLSSKNYWSQFSRAPEFVVMFLPGESFFSAAVGVDKNLMEDGWQNKVIIATPTNLIALLRAVAYGWRQEQMTRSAAKISELGKEMYERLQTFVVNFQRVGLSIERAVEAYNASVGSLEARVLVTARKFKEMGVSAKEEIGDVDQVGRLPRSLSPEEKSLSVSHTEET
ncbi:MAG: DNA recombination protein RmuC [Candidatus Omnitrophica bacterium]|nr:DNA recombination protein RmuC [Candidatus Omnitrophota bacterium]